MRQIGVGIVGTGSTSPKIGHCQINCSTPKYKTSGICDFRNTGILESIWQRGETLKNLY